MTTDTPSLEGKYMYVKRILLGPIGLRLSLALYCFFILTIIHFVSVTRNGSYHMNKERYVILFCWLAIVEALNQVIFTLDSDPIFSWHKEILHVLLYLVSSVIMSHYSLTPEFRFLILRGKFQKTKAP